MSLQPQTEFKVEEFKFSGKDDPSDNVVMNPLKGGLRTITGLVGRSNRNAYRLKTDVATIGIRGTEYSVKYTNSIEVFVTDGAISVDNQAGSFTVPGGTGVLISNDQTPPQQTDQKPVLPPETPVYEQQQQVTQQVPPPPNPFITQQTILTGTITGNWAVSSFSPSSFTALDRGIDQTIVLDANGVLTSFTGLDADFFEFPGVTTVGSSTPTSQGNDGIIAWGRWAGGQTGGDNVRDLTDVNGEGPLHYIVGLPATNLPPLGTMATYSMIGATVPSFNTSVFSSVSVLDSSLVVHFGTSSAFLNISFNVDGSVASGSNIFQNLNGARFEGSGSIFGNGFCGSISTAGFLAGEGGVRAGMAYIMGGCSTQSCGIVNGVVAYQRGAVAPSTLQPPQ
jgi:hypothetical protein